MWSGAVICPAGAGEDKGDGNAATIVDTLWPLVEQGSVAIPRGGYIIRRGRGRIAESYEAVLDEALGRAASEERLALERAVAEDAAGSSWLAAAGFFNTIASRTGLFQAAAHNVPDAALPLPSLEEWSPPAAAAVKGLLAALASPTASSPPSSASC